MRIVSMVPSLTETLIDCGVNVVGRTRFCIHPKNKVSDISIVGGTKDIDLAKALELKPDLLILDREENPKAMSELSLPFHSTHIEKIADVPVALDELAQALREPKLAAVAERWRAIKKLNKTNDWTQNLPILEWLTPIPKVTDKAFKKIFYVIWYNPWMIVGHDTFIGSMLSHLGFATELATFATKYPSVSWSEMNHPDHLILFSSEPYPFLKQKKVIPTLAASAAIVDGEKLSWFGVRSLRYLESISQR